MERHNADRTDWITHRGGAGELSNVVKEEVKKNPARFAHLALSLTADNHPAYANAFLQGLGESEVPVDSALVFQAVRHIASLNLESTDNWLGWALRPHLKSELPDDIIALLVDRALHAPDPHYDNDTRVRLPVDDQEHHERDLLQEGINTARGQAVERLGDILVYDVDGTRTALVVPMLRQLADDPSVAVRACTAHLIAACLRHAPEEAMATFQRLIETDDRLLASHHVERLTIYIANRDSAIVDPVIRRMINSDDAKVRKVGGRLAAFAGLELGAADLLTAVRESSDASVRKGAAELCAGRLPRTANQAAAGEAIQQFTKDPESDVREAAASVAVALRDRALRPFERELIALMESPSFEHATPQLLITLDRAPDRIDDLITICARRFIEVYGTDTSDISTGAAADASRVGALLLRAYVQAANDEAKSAVLDLIDELLADGAYG
ncbi:MAG: hypothetical protein LC775_17115, partial [Acidobacteria bacterium]|nr:hypothetical protein [Acidobacteriota bacterium]